ncbi:SusC/RagA family TonB-linked outer membrane protein [Neolewinella persica]|uniref:SusC/RagA family TonB-linked outer membrane protein n=1 Tax=Neolewinella persica TaxID=70998 RepID=UPI00039AE311|nr:TonB-dependent receptor [Neolewinella persica]
MKYMQTPLWKTVLPPNARRTKKRPLLQVAFLLLFLFFYLPSVVAGSPMLPLTVTGSVVDDDGPLIGVNIIVKGSTEAGNLIGTVTDFDGNFSIDVPENNSILIFTYTGYDTQEVPVGGRSVIDLKLSSNSEVLEEVVVIGYTTRKKGELTGSVSSISSKEIETISTGNITKGMAGRVSGLIINDRGGYPGDDGADAVSILIRGQATLGNNSPLIVVDGVPTNSFSFLAPGDIETFTVLKDAAAAIYGARAANGVILITTKRGKAGKPKLNFSTTNTFSGFTRVMDMMNSSQFAEYQNDYNEREGNPLNYSEQDIANYRSGNDPINYPNTNWYDLTMKDLSFETRNSLSVSGGDEGVKYFVSGNHFDQDGLFRSDALGFKQYQLRSNIDVKINDYISLGVDLSGIQGQRRQPGAPSGIIHKALQVTEPTRVGQYPNGLYGVAGENGTNPAVLASNASGFQDRRNSELRSRFTADINLGFITEGLSLRGNATFLQRSYDTKLFRDTWTVYDFNENSGEYDPINGFDFNAGNFLSVEDSYFKFNEEYYSAQLNYRKEIGKNTISGFVATERITNRSESFEAYKRDLISAEQPSLFAGSDDGQRSTGVSTESARLNYFGSISYNYDRRYLIDVTLRRDGSSNFAAGNRFGTFPGISLGWAISEEAFMGGIKGDWLSNLKLRASWAQLGNDLIPGFQFLTQYLYGGGSPGNRNYYIFGENPTQYNSFFNSNTPNPDITWEKADNRNLGLNFALFEYKLTGNANYFMQKRTDILIRRNASVPDFTALELPQENLGEVDSRGFELELAYRNSTSRGLTYNFGGNLTKTSNEVVFLDEPADVPEWRQREGFPINSFVLYPSNGLFRTQAEVDAAEVKLPGTLPGDVRYIDTDGDGEITGNDQVRRYTSPTPTLTYGFFGGISYKNLDLNFLLQGQGGADIEVRYDNEGNRPAFLADRWTPETPNGTYPRAFGLDDTYNAKLSDVWIRDADFIRLKQLELAYSIPTNTISFASIRVFVRGTNLITIDKIKDVDPEQSRYYNFTDGLYAPLKSYSFGATIQL